MLGLSVADCINDPCLFSMVSDPQKKLLKSRWKDAVLDYTAPAPHQEDLVLAKLGHGGQPAQLAKISVPGCLLTTLQGLPMIRLGSVLSLWGKFSLVPYSCPLS